MCHAHLSRVVNLQARFSTCAMTNDLIAITLSDPESPNARTALSAYYSELAQRLETGFDVGKSRDPEAHSLRPPVGGFFLALRAGTPVGCVGIKGGQVYGEIKRLWVSKDVRRAGLARRLMDAAEAQARDLGFDRLRLDTNRALPEAIAMYRNWGWNEIPRYNDDPYAQVFFEKHF